MGTYTELWDYVSIRVTYGYENTYGQRYSHLQEFTTSGRRIDRYRGSEPDTLLHEGATVPEREATG